MLSILYWIYCLAFAFDFRGDEGGSSAQFLFLALALGSGGLIVLLGRRTLLGMPGVLLILLWIGFLAFTPVVALGQGVPLGNHIRCALPLHLMGLSLLVVQVMAGFGAQARNLILPLVVASSINIAWRSLYALVIKGIPVGEIRYELLSSAAPFVIGYAMVVFFFSQRRFPVDILIAAGLTFGSLFVSITRSYIATAGFAFLACVALLYGTLKRGQWTVPALYGKLRQTVGLAIIGTVITIAIAVANPETVERWMGRLFENAGTGASTSMDVSFLTRKAEADAMFATLSANPHNYLFGVGLGATYHWDEAYLQELLLVWGSRDELNDETFFPGHSTWVYAVYSSGYLGLACYVLLFGGGLAFSWRVIRKLSVPGVPPDEYIILPFVVTWCYLSQTFTANPFMDRFAGLIIGIFLMLPQVFLARHRIEHARLVPAPSLLTNSAPPMAVRPSPTP